MDSATLAILLIKCKMMLQLMVKNRSEENWDMEGRKGEGKEEI